VADTVTPLRVELPLADVDNLQERLARTRWPAEQGLTVGGGRSGCRAPSPS
jgi:hypothetical protein